MSLTEAELRQIQRLLSLPTNQLYPGSRLRQCIQTITENDTRYNLTIVNDIQTNLAAIADLDAKIEAIKLANDDPIKRKDIEQEYQIVYKDGIDNAAGFKQQRSKLSLLIAQDLGLTLNQNTGRKYRS